TYSTRLYQQQNPTFIAGENAYYNKFRKFEALADRHFREEKSPAHYASLLAMTPRHLNRITQAVTGKTATDVILDRVLLEAKKELVLQRDSFANIAANLGYDDYAYFSRLFKNKAGETPSEFLNRYRK
ncbi:MAG: AraC family transcriptional regulator, partial [Sphingobacteriales bacterium]